MNTKKAYDIWSKQYDTNNNKTRDLEAKALRATLADIHFDTCLEIGCGTGKNTEWLVTIAKQIIAVDFSKEMLLKAKEKNNSKRILFKQADITRDWTFITKSVDLITFSLVLEHIENLDHIFKETSRLLKPNGQVYIGELHPFKQYSGSKARFDDAKGQQVLTCFNHNISDFVQSAKQHALEIMNINEYFDNNDRATIPRILTLLFKKL